MKIKILIIFIYPFILVAQSGMEIASMLDKKPAPYNLVNNIRMILTNSKGKSRINTMMSKSINKNKKQIIWFLEPKDDRGVSFLKIEHDDRDDAMRMWLPAFKKVRRISAKKKGDAFMGSDLSFEDLSSRELINNNYSRLEDEMLDNQSCYVLETIPKQVARSSYSKHISWIDKNTINLLKEHSYNKRGELKKEKDFHYDIISNYQILKRVFVKDVLDQHTTEVIFSEIKIDVELNENLFHEKNLKRIPRE